MGTYTTLFVDDYELISSKSAVVPEVMTVFIEDDRITRWRRTSDGEVVAHPDAGDAEVEREDEYVITVATACQRLDVLGFTFARCRRDYEAIRRAELERLQDAREDCTQNGAADEWVEAEILKYESLMFEAYLAGLRKVFERRIHSYDLREIDPSTLAPAEKYILEDQHDDYPDFSFFCRDVRGFLRVALSVAAPDSLVRQDVTELIASGWVAEQDRIRDRAVQLLLERYPENAPRIVLTEGSSDADILQKSLRVLYPQLVGYYTFFDFHGVRAAGGAPQLIAIVKAFAAAGVANRLIAVLDNDTAAHEARRSLGEVVLPTNITVLHYPSRDWLASYPTLGPSGDIDLDVNGRAGSLEMYLGRDVLTDNGSLIRVQWAGYSQSLRSYQGELVGKSDIAERWHRKADRCLANPAEVVPEDWQDLRAVWDHIISAYPD